MWEHAFSSNVQDLLMTIAECKAASCFSSLQPGRRMQRMRQGCFCQSDTALTGPPSRSSSTASARDCHATASALLASASLDIVYALMPSKKVFESPAAVVHGFSARNCVGFLCFHMEPFVQLPDLISRNACQFCMRRGGQRLFLASQSRSLYLKACQAACQHLREVKQVLSAQLPGDAQP